MMRIISSFVVLSLSLLLISCGVTQPIRPIEHGTTKAIASFGGPIIPFAGIAIPVPYLNFGAMYGYNQNMTVFANGHFTALLFKDVGLDAGFSSRLLAEKGIRPEIVLNGRMYFFWDAFRGNTTRFFPMGTLLGSYKVGEQSLFYFGSDNLYQFSTSDFFISPLIGYSFPISETMMMQIESKWLAMNHNTEHGVFEGMGSISGKGNIGLFFGLEYSLK